MIATKIPNTLRKSAEIVGSTDNLLTKILIRLPIKSLVDFKSVSKQWHSIITNPNFCHLRSRETKPAMALLLHSMDSSSNRKFDYVPFSAPRLLRISPILKNRLAENFSFHDIVQSCNGLFLCQNLKDRKYYVCNPTTKHSFRIPPLDEPIMGMALAFDPTKSPNYHVVCVNQCRMNCDLMLQIQIYSSETSSWKMCGDPFSTHAYYGRPVYWNGSINWIDISFAYFSYFNIDRLVLRRTLAPPIHVSGSTRYTYYFGESCDHLHFIAACQYEIQFDVYEMKRDYSEWFVKYKVDLSLVLAAYPEIIRDHNNRNYHYFTVLSLVRGEEEEEEEPFLVLHIPRKVVRYNLVSMTFQVLHEFTGDASETKICYDVLLRYLSIGFQYIESLSCV